MRPNLRSLIFLGAVFVAACSPGGATQETEGASEDAGIGSGIGSGDGSQGATCWVASASGLCPAQPIGSSPADCPSGRIFEGSGFAAGTGTCQPRLPNEDCPAGWRAVPLRAEGSGLDGLLQATHCEPPPPPTDCPPGTIALPGDVACRPLGTTCPSTADRWPDEAALRALAPTFTGPVFYAASDAAADGAGTRDNPRLLNAATLRAAESGIVALAMGDYSAAIRLDRHVALVGACVAATTLTASSSSDSTGTIDIAAAAPAAVANLTLTGDRPGVTVQPGASEPHALSAIAIVGARTAGIIVTGAQSLRLTDLRIEGTRASAGRTFGRGLALTEGATVLASGLALRGNRDIALSLDGAATSLTADRLLITDTIERLTDGTFGRAIDLRGGARADLTASAMISNREVALAADGIGTSLTATDLFVSGTRARARDSLAGRGLELTGGATATLSRAAFSGHLDLTLSLDGTGTLATLDNVLVERTAGALLTGANGYGASVTGGASLRATALVVSGSHSAGLLASGARTRLTLTDSLITATDPDIGGAGNGLAVESGAIADLHRTLLSGNTEAALFATGTGSRVEADDLTLTNTRSNSSDGRAGLGIWLQAGANLVGDRLLLRANRFAAAYATGQGTDLQLRGLVVAGTLPQSGDGRGGMGLFLTEGATATVEGATLLANHEVGLLLDGASATLRDLFIADTLPRASGLHGSGIELQRGATLTLERALLQRNRGVGLLVSEAGSSLRFSNLAVEDTLPRPAPLGGFGTGLTLLGGGAATGTDLTLTRNRLCGLQLAGEALALDIERASLTFNPVGIVIQGPGFGLAELRAALRDETFASNGADVSTETLDLPEPVRDLR